jgi:hypothetical protein
LPLSSKADVSSYSSSLFLTGHIAPSPHHVRSLMHIRSFPLNQVIPLRASPSPGFTLGFPPTVGLMCGSTYSHVWGHVHTASKRTHPETLLNDRRSNSPSYQSIYTYVRKSTFISTHVRRSIPHLTTRQSYISLMISALLPCFLSQNLPNTCMYVCTYVCMYASASGSSKARVRVYILFVGAPWGMLTSLYHRL